MSMLLAVGAMAAFIILVFVPGCTQTRYAVLSMAPYRDGGMPPEPFAQQDSDAFRERLAAVDLPQQIDRTGPTSAAGPASLLGNMTGKSVTVIYVTALAARTGNGIVIYPADARPDEAEACIPLERLWDFLAELPAAQKKIIVLDLARGPIDWRWGQLVPPLSTDSKEASGSAPAELRTALSKVPNLAILCSAAPGETSWSSPSLGNSVFAHYLLRALEGAADSDQDRRLTLAEMYDYVSRHVNHWVVQNRDLRGQHPQLFATNESRDGLMQTVVAELRGGKRPATSNGVSTTEGHRSKDLEALWDARDKWDKRPLGQHPAEWHPIGWRRFLEHLRRAEAWLLAGQPAGMPPHLKAARDALIDLERHDPAGSPRNAEPGFVAAGLSRRMSAQLPSETSPPLPDHLLKTVLQKLGPAGLSNDVINSMTSLRADAERIAWHSFRSRIWSGHRLLAADQDRRLAEDRLFVGGASELEQSASARQQAAGKLQQIDQVNRELQQAVHLHQRLLAELPDLAWWAARRFPLEDVRHAATFAETRRGRIMRAYSLGIDQARFNPPSLEDQEKLHSDAEDSSLQQLEIDLLLLFQRTRELARILDRELEAGAAESFTLDGAWRSELKSLREALTDPNRGLDALRQRLQRHAAGLVGTLGRDQASSPDKSESQSQFFHWQRLRNALQWSGLDAETRRGLFADLSQTDRNLHVHTDQTPGTTDAPWTGITASGTEGCWQGLWALQTLSLSAVNTTQAVQPGLSETAMHELWVVWKNAVVDDNKRIDLLVELGELVRSRFQQLSNATQPALNSVEGLPEALRILLQAERAARTLHGYDAVALAPNEDPVQRLREFDRSALCIAQAERYIEDFWGKPDSKDREPWYVQAAEQCLQETRRRAATGAIPAVDKARRMCEDRLQILRTARLQLQPAQTELVFGLETQRPLEIKAEFDAAVPQGVAALWVEHEESRPVEERVLRIQPADRRAVTASASTARFDVQRPSPVRDAGQCETIPVKPQLLYRGRLWSSGDDVVMVDPCPPQSIEWEYQPPPTLGQIAVFGLDRRDTIFVLDCSESMNELLVQQQSRWSVAIKTLQELLQKLHDDAVVKNEVPHRVGLLTFGHRLKLVDPQGRFAVNPQWKNDPELPNNALSDFQLLFKPRPLTREFLAELNQTLTNRLEPYGNTPLLGAMRRAGSELAQRDNGLIVCITDGEWQDGNQLANTRNFFRNNKRLSLQLVAYGPQAQGGQLQNFIQQTRSNNTPSEAQRIRLHAAPQVAGLQLALARALAPRKYHVISTTARPVQDFELPLGEASEKLPAGRYSIQFPGIADAEVALAGGEHLVFDVDASAGRLKHRRPHPQLSRKIQAAGTVSTTEPTRFGYLKAAYDKVQGTAEFLFCLDRDDDLGIIERPAEIRIDVLTRDGSMPRSQSWQLAEGYSIPVWRYSFKGWPTETPPKVRATWKPVRTEPDLQLAVSTLLEGSQTVSVPGWPARSFTITAESQPGKLLIRLQAAENAGGRRPSDLRLELGRQSLVEQRFLPLSVPWRADVFHQQGQVLYRFDVEEGFDPQNHWIAITSRDSLEQGARTVESLLSIVKWDSEL